MSNGNKKLSHFDGTLPSSLTDMAEEMFFVCAVMCNFMPLFCII